MSDCGTFLRHRDVAAPGEEAESREGLGRCALGEDGAATLIARRRAGGPGGTWHQESLSGTAQALNSAQVFPPAGAAQLLSLKLGPSEPNTHRIPLSPSFPLWAIPRHSVLFQAVFLHLFLLLINSYPLFKVQLKTPTSQVSSEKPFWEICKQWTFTLCFPSLGLTGLYTSLG